jgi:nitrogen regulatory protein PII-like uncharacterized protein
LNKLPKLTTKRLARKAISVAVCVAIGAVQVAQSGSAYAANPPANMSRAEYEACQARDEAGFRLAVEQLTAKALQRGLTTIDYKSVVSTQWRKANVDELLDKRIDSAISEVKDQTGRLDMWRSLADSEKAKAIATTVAERVYQSAEFKTAIEALANGVGGEVAKTIELATLDAGEPALACMNAFLGPRYGQTIAGVVSRDAGREFSLDASKGAAQVSTGSVIAQNSEGIAGAIVLLIRRQLATMAGRVGQRLAGTLMSRLVGTFAGGIGVALVAKDLYDLWDGVLPIIAKEMKSSASKDKVREEIAKVLAEQISEHTRDIAVKTSERVVEIWHDFRKAHAKVVDLTERNEAFKGYVDQLKPEQLARLDEIVALILGSEGEAGVVKRLADGTLALGVSQLPNAGLEIARDKRSLEIALNWMTLAGPNLAKVVEFDLHRLALPEQFSKAALVRVLALNDRTAITRIGALNRDAREKLLELDDAALTKLAKGLDARQLETLSSYLTGLTQPVAARVLKTVALAPQRMQVLASPRVRDAVLASRDQLAAVDMLLKDGPAIEPTVIAHDIRLVVDGRISPMLMVDRHPSVMAIAAGLSLILLLMVKRLLFGRRRAKAFIPAERTDA